MRCEWNSLIVQKELFMQTSMNMEIRRGKVAVFCAPLDPGIFSGFYDLSGHKTGIL